MTSAENVFAAAQASKQCLGCGEYNIGGHQNEVLCPPCALRGSRNAMQRLVGELKAAKALLREGAELLRCGRGYKNGCPIGAKRWCHECEVQLRMVEAANGGGPTG